MVFFTCNNCGDAVKKASVEKHYDRKCRGKPVRVSCMDCLKDFNDDEYVAHTKCISEAAKYSGKDFVPKESKATGAKKQEGWVGIVHSILDSGNDHLSPGVRVGLERLKKYENIPRKKAKFQNFAVKSAYMSHHQAEEVWRVLEKELEKLKLAKQQALEAKESDKSNSNGDKTLSTEAVLNGNAKAAEEEDNEIKMVAEYPKSSQKKKSKKSKTSSTEAALNENGVAGEEEGSDTKIVTENPESSQKKKSKKTKTSSTEAVLSGNKEVGEVETNDIKMVTEYPKSSQKKESKKSETFSTEIASNGIGKAGEEEGSDTKIVTENPESCQKKKSKKTKTCSTETFLNGNTEAGEEVANDTKTVIDYPKDSQKKESKKTKKRIAAVDTIEIAPVVAKKSKTKENPAGAKTSTSGGEKQNPSTRNGNENFTEGKTKSKKRKNLNPPENNATKCNGDETVVETPAKKQKIARDDKLPKGKKSKKKNNINAPIDPEAKIFGKGMPSFNWKATIRNIVNKNTEGIPLEKFNKKLLKEYISVTGLSKQLNEKQHGTFHRRSLKYIKKCTDIKVTDDNVIRKC